MNKSTIKNSSPQSGTMNESSPLGRASNLRKSFNRIALILLVTFFFGMNARAQVSIPDNNFFNYLVNTLGFNPVGPNQIALFDAEFYTDPLDISNLGISDLTGIQAFVSLQTLYCPNNS